MSTPNTYNLFLLSDADKFDGTNWLAWRLMIETATEAHGTFGYLDSMILQPPLTSPGG